MKYGVEEFKIIFRFLYWGVINQERKQRRRRNWGGDGDLLNYGYVGDIKLCGRFVFLGIFCDLRCKMYLFLWQQFKKV